jgi:hypothetical protein
VDGFSAIVPSLYPEFDFFIGNRPPIVGIFQAALHHQIKGKLADYIIVGAIVRLTVQDVSDVFLGCSHKLPPFQLIIKDSSPGYNKYPVSRLTLAKVEIADAEHPLVKTFYSRRVNPTAN